MHPTPSQLPANIVTFARVLRHLGLPAGSGEVLQGIRALDVVGLDRRDDVFWALHSVFVRRQEHSELFGMAFHRFWRDPDLPENPMHILPPDRIGVANPEPLPGARRVGEVWATPPSRAPRRRPPRAQGEQQIRLGAYSATEVLKRKDFEQMSAEEIRTAKEAIRRLDLRVGAVRTRRWAVNPRGSGVDMRATLKATLRSAGDWSPLVRKRQRTRPPALVALCDISGSMESYSRMLLHFLHALTNHHHRVHSFVFGTRLTNVTRALAHRDVDDALVRLSDQVPDWAGGTRIGSALGQFNRRWSRRVLSQGAVVLLISDGLDREPGPDLAREAARLSRSCRELIWLNPLLRFDDFEPRAQGIVDLLPWVTRFRPAHNLAALEGLVDALSGAG